MTIRYTATIPMFLIGICTTAQTLDQGNNGPVVGDEFIQHQSDYMDPGPAGAGQTWNFAALQTDETLTTTGVMPTAAPNGAAFTGATVAFDAGGGAYLFLKNSVTGLENVGAYALSISLVYQDPEQIMKYPCALNTTWTDSWSSNFTSGGFPVARSGTSTGLADGSGTLITPYGTISNVLRVKLHQVYTDNIGGLMTVNYDAVNYYYYKPGVHMALVQLSNLTSSASTPQTYATWLDEASVGIQEALRNTIGLDVFPNPATDQVSVVFGSPGGTITLEVTDGTGRVVVVDQLRSNGAITRHDLDLARLTPGLYQVRVTDAKGNQGVKRLVVQ
ncbi:MAG: T9SS type A sorting domain-containing protein [Flavobacteriales bacterium]|nr:T9SS type A sorting domain-containing protein [Flavobacteriales bacterium]